MRGPTPSIHFTIVLGSGAPVVADAIRRALTY
jgi:hypothetical protein